MERSNNEYKESRINQLEEEISDYKFRIDNMEINLHTNNEEIKEKEENLFQLSGKIYNL